MPLSSVVGHRALVGLLLQATGRKRVPQSLLFAGPEGVGKHAVALALAQAVNCPQPVAGDACGKCSTCLRIARGQHADVTVIDRGDKASIGIEPLRDRLLEVVGYRPFEAAKRVYIIDPADEMTPPAQDALLKTLEEPPSSAILILVTAFPDQLRPTVLSRCRRLRFGPLSENDVARVLVETCRMAPKEAALLSAVSGGSVARALADSSGDLADDREAALGLLQAGARGQDVQVRLKAAAALAQVGSKRRVREALGVRLALVASLLRDLGVMATGIRETQQLANADLADSLRALTGSFSLARVADGATAVDRAQTSLDRFASPKIIADWIALNI